jgi:hypothetical protein
MGTLSPFQPYPLLSMIYTSREVDGFVVENKITVDSKDQGISPGILLINDQL